MALFSYKAKSEVGKIVDGQVKAKSKEELTILLKEKGYSNIEITSKDFFSNLKNSSMVKGKVGSKDVAVFCRQFAIILQAGVPIATALDVLRTQSTNKILKSILNEVYDSMKKGIPLSVSLKAHRASFSDLLIHMVEAGEVTGQLEDVFSRMADTFEKDNKLRSKIKGSLSYPVIMVVVAVAVVTILMVKVVPSFVDILHSFKVEMPKMTLFLISISNFFQKAWFIVLILVVGIIFGVKASLKSELGRSMFDSFLLKIPLIGGILVKIITARFTRTMSILLSSGVHLIQCMEVVQKIVGNVIIQNKLNEVINEVKKGKGLFGPLSNMNFFPPMVMSMVKIGEESGELDFALDKCADYYDQEVETGLQTLTSLIEPLVMIVMSVVVGFIVLSVLYPMFSIYENLSK